MAGARRRCEKSRFPLRLEILFVGKAKGGPLASAIEAWALRIGRYARLELRSYRQDGSATLDRALSVSPFLALDPAGREIDSAAFRQVIEQRMADPGVPLRFLIGGADGLSLERKRQAADLLSLSQLTLSHDLARLLLLEQIYRALASMAGSPYAR